MDDARRAGSVWMPRSARLLTGAFLLAFMVAGCAGQSRAPFKFDTDVFTHAIFSPDNQILNGLMLTVVISVVSQIIGIVLGIFGALGRMSRRAPFRMHRELLHLGLPRDSAAGPDRVLLLRPGRRAHLRLAGHQPAGAVDPRRDPGRHLRARPQRRRLHVRDRAGRDHLDRLRDRWRPPSRWG